MRNRWLEKAIQRMLPRTKFVLIGKLRKCVRFLCRIIASAWMLGFVSLCISTQTVHAASVDVGEITIDGEAIPIALFEYYWAVELRNYKDCPPTELKEKVIDLVVIKMMNEKESGGGQTAKSVIESLQDRLSSGSVTAAIDNAGDELHALGVFNRSYLKMHNFYVTQSDIDKEHQIRARDRDPYITDVTVVRVLEIRRPSGSGSNEKLSELAALIKEGMPFEEAEAKYPVRRKVENQKDIWVTLSSLRHDIDPGKVKAGDIYGLEKVLEQEIYDEPMVKIYEVKTLSTVNRSDEIYDEPVFKKDNFGSLPYLERYLSSKAVERKRQLFFSKIWSNYTIAENEVPMERVGIYKPCNGL